MQRGFLDFKIILGIAIVTVLVAGVVAAVYLSQRQTQIKSQASACTIGQACGGSDTACGAGGAGKCDACNGGWCNGGKCEFCGASGEGTCQTDCSKCDIGNDKCGNRTYSPSNGCDYSTCTSPTATYTCKAQGNSNCQGTYTCGSACVTASPVTANRECVPNAKDYANCRSCGGDGKWIVDYGPKDGANWCACATSKSGAQFAQANGCSAGGAGGVANGNTCPVTASCCSSPLKKCTGTSGKDPSCPAGFQWCYGGFCVNENYNQKTDSCQKEACSKDDFGDPAKIGKEAWCACAKNFAIDYATSPTYSGCAGNTTSVGVSGLPDQSTNPDDGSSCKYEVVDDNLKVSPPLTSGRSYRAKVYMTNTGKTIWNKGTYKLSTKNMSMWGVKELYGISAPESKFPNDIVRGDQAIFEIPITAPVVTRYETFPMYFVMKNAEDKWFGAACEPKEVQVQPEVVKLATACFAISENQADVSSITKCDDKTKVQSYSKDPLVLPYSFKDTTPGLKTIYVRFISNLGDIKDVSRQILYTPDPILDAIVCTRSSTGQGTLIGVRGQNFGPHAQQGSGFVKVNGELATIISWDETKNAVVASTPKLLEGVSTVDFKNDNGKQVSGTCTLGISTVSFTLSTQCNPKNTFNSGTVELRLQEATSGAKPFISKSLTVSKGVPQSFAPNVERGKKYSMLIRAPRTLVKKVDFVADEGTKNLGDIKLWLGDIAPKTAPDGSINVFDKAEMVNQWSVLETKTLRSADLNGDGTVNNHDYSCQKIAIGQQNEANIDGL